ncbi:MAG: helix-turn-helix domain-containing protein [Rhodopseudomonas sp.]|nr:helix-turn-helix domain-containing protein [Rhodopseudomonas sp.]
MTVRFENTDSGEVAIMPRQEYEALLAKAAEVDEDAGMVRLVARAREEIAAGAPLIPMDVAERIADGENRIKVLRNWRDLTQIDMAQKTGLSQSYLSEIERGDRTGTVAALRKIAGALGVPLDMLLTD